MKRSPNEFFQVPKENWIVRQAAMGKNNRKWIVKWPVVAVEKYKIENGSD